MSEPVFSIFPNENFVDLSLYQYGMEQCPPAYSFLCPLRDRQADG